MTLSQKHGLSLLLILVLLLQIGAWLQVRSERAHWLNVPPVPGRAGAVSFGLGDPQLSYRSIGIMLQNIGDTGGMTTSFKGYDYDALGGWFTLADTLDPRANFMPMLAGFYFGAVEDPEKLRPLTEYLHRVGLRTDGDKWRWLAQAIYLRRFKMNDLDTASQWAEELAHMDKPDMPIWTKQMPAFVLNARGDKQAAYDIMVEILKSGKNTMPREEINAMTYYICHRILDKNEAETNPLCQAE